MFEADQHRASGRDPPRAGSTIDLTEDHEEEMHYAHQRRVQRHLSYEEMAMKEEHAMRTNHHHSQSPSHLYERDPAAITLITVLIIDRRGHAEPELAELYLPMKQKGGKLWVDAADVCEALQKGPSRIDGMA
jgi:hypothetical protein